MALQTSSALQRGVADVLVLLERRSLSAKTEYEEKLRVLTQERDDLLKQVHERIDATALTAELEALRAERDSWQQERARMEQERAHWEQERTQFKQERATLEGQLAKWADELNTTSKERDELVWAQKSLQEQLRWMKRENEDLNTYNEQLKNAINDACRLASPPSEAIREDAGLQPSAVRDVEVSEVRQLFTILSLTLED